MTVLYEVLYSVLEEELKKYVVANDEADLVDHLSTQALESQAYFAVAEEPEMEFSSAFSSALGPVQLTKDQTLGVWLETTPV